MTEFIKRLWHRDVFLFFTHTPCGFRVGQSLDGKVITRVERERLNTALYGGGSVPCFRVYGKRQ